jgi:hypothetical protein
MPSGVSEMFRQSWLMQITSKQCQEKDQTKAATQTSCRSGSKEGKKRVLTLCSQLIHGGRHRDTARELIVAEQGHLQAAAVLQQRHSACQLIARHIQDLQAD